jgi:hypothetical protein
MKKLLSIAFALAVCFTSKIHHNEVASVATGAWSSTAVDSTIDQFIRQQYPGLEGSTLTSTQSQIVAGTNYLYTYTKGNTSWTVSVFDQPWTSTRQINGVKKTTNSTDPSGNPVTTVTGTSLDSRDFTTIARTQIKL